MFCKFFRQGEKNIWGPRLQRGIYLFCTGRHLGVCPPIDHKLRTGRNASGTRGVAIKLL